jgi:RNA polymerase sigma-70 factor (ECF subfamily)
MSDLQTDYERIIGPLEDRMISSIWRIVRNPTDAEDAMQNALATVWQRWSRVTKHPNPEALVLKICIDAACDTLRRRVREQRMVQSNGAPSESAAAHRAAGAEMAEEELHAAVMTAIQRLSRNQAVATLMRIVQGQSYEQIAAALGCSEVTARKHVERGRERLRRLLSQFEPEYIARTSP